MSATLQVIHSGSEANGYILTCGENKLILEAGCRKEEYLKALNFDLTKVVGVCVTHYHSDHSRSIKALQDYGLQVFSSKSVQGKHSSVNVIEPMKRVQIGGFKVMALEVPHGDCPNYAYVIDPPDNQRILFCTDAERLPYNVKGCHHLMLECNYSSELILDSLINGDILRSQSQNHMELEECIATVKRLRHEGLQSVILVHLSNGLSDEKIFKDRFKSEFGIDVDFAESSKTFRLESCEF